MKSEIRRVYYDKELGVEACFFEGISQPFPPHFHEYYVIGFIESGTRRLFVCGKELTAGAGDILIFNPLDNHFCRSSDGGTLTYGAFHIKADVMRETVCELTGSGGAPHFPKNVIRDADLFFSLKKLHEAVMYPQKHTVGFEKEELFLLTFSQLAGEYSEHSESAESEAPECRAEIEKACLYMRENFPEHISLDKLCRLTALSRAALVRSFTKEKGISPYRYLENVRLNAAKQLLEQGESPVEAALKTGFSDQSHFTNFFKAYIGLTPKQYGNIFTPN